MAINRFENVRHVVTDTATEIYTTPVGFSSIVILAQATNVTGNTSNITFSLEDGEGSTTYLTFENPIPSNDSAGLLTGKLVLKEGQKIAVSGSQSGALQLVLSILETED